MRADHPSDAEIRDSLARLLDEPDLARSPQLVEFLVYVVDQTLAGREDRLKAYSIGTDVFGRDENFDPQSDSIVRVQAGRLRRILELLYERGVSGASVRISLPVGRYIPQFDPLVSPPSTQLDLKRFKSLENANGDVTVRARPRRAPRAPARGRTSFLARLWNSGTFAIVGAALVFVATVVTASLFGAGNRLQGGADLRPVLIVGDLMAETGLEDEARILKTMLIEKLSSFDRVDVRLSSPRDLDVFDRRDRFYRLDGQLHLAERGIGFNVVVTRQGNSQVVWSRYFERENNGTGQSESLNALADTIAANTAAARGAIQTDRRTQLSEASFAGADADIYACRFLFRDGLGFTRNAELQAARQCFIDVLKQRPGDDLAEASLAAVDSLVVARAATPGSTLSSVLQSQIAVGASTVSTLPDSSYAHELYATILRAAGDIAGAQREYLAALQDNPGNTDAEAMLGIMMVFDGRSEGVKYVEHALATAQWPAGWYYTARALTCLLQNDHEDAIHYALMVMPEDEELGHVILVAAAAATYRDELVTANLPNLMANKTFQSVGIMPRIAMRVKDIKLLEAIRAGLDKAGIRETALNHSYHT